jgi:hypothetical protein
MSMWCPTGARDLLRAAAVEYAGQYGWRVAPAYYPYTPGRHRRTPARRGARRSWQCACGQAGCPAPGGHPVSREWLRDASTDPAAIEFWWWGPRPWNVAVVTGELFDVWSAPVAVAGRALDLLGGAGRALGPVAYSPDGRWLFFTQPRIGLPVPVLPAPLRYQGEGSYLLAPPSWQAVDRVRWWRPPSGPAVTRPSRWEPIYEALLAAVESEGYLARSE